MRMYHYWTFGLFFWMAMVNAQECMQDCSTISENANYNDNTIHPISCLTQSKACDIRSKNVGKITNARLVNSSWYLFKDSKNVRVGLNFSWRPDTSGSFEYINGYKVSIEGKRNALSYGRAEKYLCISTILEEIKHVQAHFSYDCFGHSTDFHVVPGETYIIKIMNLPSYDNDSLQFSISVPSCDDPRMKAALPCIIYVSRSFCNNSGEAIAEIEYKLPFAPEDGTTSLQIKEYLPPCLPPDYPNNCNIINDNVFYEAGFPVSDRRNVSLPANYKRHENGSFMIDLWYSPSKRYRTYLSFTLPNCSKKPDTQQQSSPLPVPLIVVISLVFLILVVILTMCVIFRCSIARFKRWFRKVTGHKDEQVESKDPESIKKKKVYIIFVDEHSIHRDVVSKFAAFLGVDLGFDVVLELYDRNEISKDPVHWMETKLSESDKVLVIWSPGAVTRWNNYNNEDSVKHDLFTPVLKKVRKDLFNEKNTGKYCFGYFEYCKKDDIPTAFRDPSICHFKLMKQIDELYRQLKSSNSDGKHTLSIEEKIVLANYGDPNLNRNGPALESAICDMTELVKDDAAWYDDVSCSYTSPTDIDYYKCEIVLNKLKIIPPDPLMTLADVPQVEPGFQDKLLEKLMPPMSDELTQPPSHLEPSYFIHSDAFDITPLNIHPHVHQNASSGIKHAPIERNVRVPVQNEVQIQKVPQEHSLMQEEVAHFNNHDNFNNPTHSQQQPSSLDSGFTSCNTKQEPSITFTADIEQRLPRTHPNNNEIYENEKNEQQDVYKRKVFEPVPIDTEMDPMAIFCQINNIV